MLTKSGIFSEGIFLNNNAANIKLLYMLGIQCLLTFSSLENSFFLFVPCASLIYNIAVCPVLKKCEMEQEANVPLSFSWSPEKLMY